MIYRLELLPRPMEEPDDEMLDFYLHNGWEYVTTLNRLFWVLRALPGTAEIHTDVYKRQAETSMISVLSGR